MNQFQGRPKKKKLLIYIPCHTDYSEALEQARFIRNEYANVNLEQRESLINIHIHISINGIDLPLEKINEIKEITQSHAYTPENIGADANIAQGFNLGQEVDYSFLWILSANEKIKSGGIELILKGISLSNGCHIILIGNEGNFVVTTVNNPLQEALERKPLGLISAVIFNSELCRKQYSQARQFAHTGWGQLSVLVQIQNKVRQLKCLCLDSSKIYTVDAREILSKAIEYERIGRTYSRSFFGFPVLAMTLFPSPSKTGKAIFRKWLVTNLHLIAYFDSFVAGKESLEVRESFQEILRTSGMLNRLLVRLANNDVVLSIFRLIKRGN
jgi:hypothetical protein